MAPLSGFSARPANRRRRLMDDPRRLRVELPDVRPTTDAMFMLLRRMRMPLFLLVTIFSISVLGLSLIEGIDDQGRPYRMSAFDAFYFMSYTASSIGFGEIPYTFTTAQRLWVAASIYMAVVGWATTIARLASLFQEQAFRDAVAVQGFRRRVRRMTEPFLILAGFGHAGLLVARGLDGWGKQFVVIDGQQSRIEVLSGDQLSSDPAGLAGDLTDPAMLTLAGLGHPQCAGVLALTDDDEVNLATVMAVHLLRPEVPVIARCSDRDIEDHMHDFAPAAVINPYDRFGGYLLLALQRPSTYQLVSWLMSPRGTELPPRREELGKGRWVVCADGHFGTELVNDLSDAGQDVVIADPADGDPDVAGAVGFVAGTERDTTNMSLAVHARLVNPGLFIVLRQRAHTNAPMVQALDFDSVFMPTDLVAREMVSRVTTPTFSSFLDHALDQSDQWAAALLGRITERCGRRTPEVRRIAIDPRAAPSLTRWLRAGRSFTVGDLMRDPDDRDQQIGAVVLAVLRRKQAFYAPQDDVRLRPGDGVLVAGRSLAHGILSETLYYDAVTEYVATGRQVPQTWIWRALTGRRSARKDPPTAA